MGFVEIDELIMGLSKKAGRIKGVNIDYPSELGTQRGGEWELSWDYKSPEEFLITLTYWWGSSEAFDETILLHLSLPPTDEQVALFLHEVSAVVDKIRQRANT